MSRTTSLRPLLNTAFDCPHCRVRLVARGWLIPGMRNLADLICPTCSRGYFGDLPAGQALYTPMLIEKSTGHVHDHHNVPWFADWLSSSYANRRNEALPLQVIDRKPISGAIVILNCLDVMYGHSLLKLLNAQYLLDRPQAPQVIIIVPRWIAWMVPNEASQIWIVDIPIRRGTEWSDTLASRIASLTKPLHDVSLAHALSHPREEEFEINRFTGVQPFALGHWDDNVKAPCIAFIWRDDRLWTAESAGDVSDAASLILQNQFHAVTRLAEVLRNEWPAMTFAVVGTADRTATPAFPEWIDDLRRSTMDDETERAFCELYARCHVVIGVHGSNMLLPSAHAGAVIEFLGPERFGNFTQDILFRDLGDRRELLFRYRFLKADASADTVASLTKLIVEKRSAFMNLMNVSIGTDNVTHND